MSKFIFFGVMSGTPALLTYKVIDLYCRYIMKCSDGIQIPQLFCATCIWILGMIGLYALEGKFGPFNAR